MAKLFSEYGSAQDKDRISLDVRPWALGATRHGVMFYGRAGFTGAPWVIWADVTFAADEVPLAYQRVLFQFEFELNNKALEEVLSNGGEFQWQIGWYPELSIFVERFVPDPEFLKEIGEEPEPEAPDPTVKVRLAYDFSPCVNDHMGNMEYGFTIGSALASDVRVFLETLSEEINLVRQDVHPDPALLPPVPTFQFAKQLLARAYNNLQENPPPPSDAPRPQLDFGKIDALSARWQGMVPAQGHILELGCGEGDDRTIGEWLRDGYRVTGVDVSGASLARARKTFPQATFLEMMPSELRAEQEFDAAYSAFMFLHMDPIELRVALHRIHCALKPDAPFFVLSVVENAQVRYSPVDMYSGERVWQWYYEPEEIVRAFTEHGHFVVEAQEVVVVDGDIADIEALTTKSLLEILQSRGKRVTFAYAILARKVG